ncbi:hypothetical protein E2C01_061712 [Portunus trituberculatus]|uniref:Uncharacterized protein n=1 Tax=Portunus trituberculatus TaxID=210409 RepID=A0A5B7HD52_PORTR|nr:hypothetical protein [Portunus trituberculatus]
MTIQVQWKGEPLEWAAATHLARNNQPTRRHREPRCTGSLDRSPSALITKSPTRDRGRHKRLNRNHWSHPSRAVPGGLTIMCTGRNLRLPRLSQI